jgi:hypothetical protein
MPGNFNSACARPPATAANKILFYYGKPYVAEKRQNLFMWITANSPMKAQCITCAKPLQSIFSHESRARYRPARKALKRAKNALREGLLVGMNCALHE